MSPFRLEICIDSLASALAAGPYLREGDRFEVCGSLLAGGGTTPSIGLVAAIREKVPHVALMVMIRPRPGSFVYFEPEIEVMIADIAAAREAGAAGVVFGCLDEDGNVDVEQTKRLVEASHGMEVTFHRAFDVTPFWQQAADAIASLGITRILTSGHAKTALDGAAEIDALTRHVRAPLTILPGSGINAGTLAELRRRAPLLTEAHFTASAAVPGPQTRAVALGAQLGFGADEWVIDPAKVKAVRELVDSWDA